MKNRNIVILCTFIFILLACKETNDNNTGYRLIEEVTKDDEDYVIPYKKYILDNGLTVIIHEDNSNPLVHLNVSYHVGSARDEIDKSGFAHFFEHMMFEGSENIKGYKYKKIIIEGGGKSKGTTNKDFTNFSETVPVNQLETVLWLESDRMGYLLDAVTQEKFEIQRATVKNEKEQNYYNKPYREYLLLRDRALFPYGHPYSWPTIGEIEDINRVGLEDLKKFFLRWYGPNNATITIGGQVVAEEVIKMVYKYFGDIKRGPEVSSLKLEAPKLTKKRYVSYEDKNIELPAISLIWPTVPSNHPDAHILYCLSSLIVNFGEYFPLYNAFLRPTWRTGLSAYSTSGELAGYFTFFKILNTNQPLGEAEENIYKTLKWLEENGITDEALTKYKSAFESSIISGFETVTKKVKYLSYYQGIYNNPNIFKKQINSILNITKKDLIRVYEKYIKNKPNLVISIIPKGSSIKSVQPDNYKIPMMGNSKFPTTDYRKVKYVKNKSTFDRSIRPTPGETPILKTPSFWQDKINGVTFLGSKSQEVPLIHFTFNIRGGTRLEKAGKYGLSNLVARMMNFGTEKLTLGEYTNELSKLGSKIYVHTNRSSITISVTTLKKNFDKTIAIVKDVLLTPQLNSTNLSTLKKRVLSKSNNSSKNSKKLSADAFLKLSFKENDRRHYPIVGIKEDIKNITIEDIKAFHNNNFSPHLASVLMVGDINKNAFLDAFSFLNNWKKKNVIIPEFKKPLKYDKPIVYLINNPHASQSRFHFGYITDLKYDIIGKYFKSKIMNFPFAGNSKSRIKLNLRDTHGFTYSGSGHFRLFGNSVAWILKTNIKGSKTVEALKEVIYEMKEYRKNGITDKELMYTKKSLLQKNALKYESLTSMRSFLNLLSEYKLDKDFVKTQAEIIKNITKDEINELIKEYIDVNKMIFIIVGDEGKLKSKLKNERIEVKTMSINL